MRRVASRSSGTSLSLSMRSLTFFAIAVAVVCGTAETSRAQSLFAREGIGVWREGYSLAARGAGGAAIGRIEQFPSSALNPASAAFATTAQFHAALLTEQSWSTTEAGKGGRSGLVRIPGLRVIAPLGAGIHLALGYRDLTEGAYRVEETVNRGASDELTRKLEGRGALGGYTLGLSRAFFAGRLAVGAEGGLARGTLQEEVELDFTAAELRDATQLLRTRMEDGNIWTLGFQARVIEPLSVGAFWQAESRLRLTSLYENGSGVGIEERARLGLPSGFGIGAAWSVRPGAVLAFDYVGRAWSDVEFSLRPGGGVTPRGFSGAEEAAISNLEELPDASRLGVGITLQRPGLEANDPFSKRIIWRAGLAREELSVPTSTGDPVVALSGSFGVGLPVQRDRGSIDLLFEFGSRGDTEEVGLSEKFFRFGVGVGFGTLQPAF